MWKNRVRGESLKRRAGRMLLSIVLCVSVIVTAGSFVCASEASEGSEAAEPGWVTDGAGLLSESEETDLEEKSEQIYEKYGVSVVIITTEQYEGEDILDWERTLYASQSAEKGEDGDCLMLGVSMAERDWGMTAYGDAERIFGAYSRETIGEAVVEKLSEGDYAEAFDTYLDMAEQFLEDASESVIYSSSHPYREKWNIGLIIIGSFVVSLAISALIVVSWKRKMNTKMLQNSAGAYLKEGRAELTGRSDVFLYHTVSRTRRQKNNNSGGSMHSSGNGTSGKF